MVSGKPAIKGVESKIRVIFVFVCEKSDKGKEIKDSFINRMSYMHATFEHFGKGTNSFYM